MTTSKWMCLCLVDLKEVQENWTRCLLNHVNDWRTSFCCSAEAGLSDPKKYFLLRYLFAMWDDLSCLTALSLWGVLLYCSRSSQHVRWILSRNTRWEHPCYFHINSALYRSYKIMCAFPVQFNVNMMHICRSGTVYCCTYIVYLFRKRGGYRSNQDKNLIENYCSPGSMILEEGHKVPDLMTMAK